MVISDVMQCKQQNRCLVTCHCVDQSTAKTHIRHDVVKKSTVRPMVRNVCELRFGKSDFSAVRLMH